MWRDQEGKKTEHPSHLELWVETVHFLSVGVVMALCFLFSRCAFGGDALGLSIPMRPFQVGPNSSVF